MTAFETSCALQTGVSVMHKGIVYARITARILRVDKHGKRIYYAELLDRSGRSVTIAPAREVKLTCLPTELRTEANI